MASQSMFRPTVGRLAAKVRMFILGVASLGLLGALGLGYAGYRAHQFSTAVGELPKAASLFRAQTAVLHQLSDMEKAFDRYLLDGNSSSLELMDRDKSSVEQYVQIAQQDPELQSDKLMPEMLAKAQAWRSQVQPLIDERKNLPAGQGLSEEFLSHYRQNRPSLDLIGYEIKAEGAYRHPLENLTESEKQTKVWFLLFCLSTALLLIVAILALAASALRHVGSMRSAAGS
jgi:hypothetical protein